MCFGRFIPNANSVPQEPWNSATLYYPGDQYVDILGMDGYDWAVSETPSFPFTNVFSSLYMELKMIAPDKPIFIFETAASKNKQNWVDEGLIAAKKWDIKAIIWFQVNKKRLEV